MTPHLPACFYRVSAKALILDSAKKKFLVGLESSGKWSLLGGGMEWGENAEQCLERELREEAGFEVITLNPAPAYVLPGQRDDGDWSIDLVHEVIISKAPLIPSPECLEVRYVTAEEAKGLPSYKSLQRFARVFDSALHSRRSGRTEE